MDREQLLDQLFEEAVYWYKLQMVRFDVTSLVHPDSLKMSDFKNIFWELEEEIDVSVNNVDKLQALEDAWGYLSDLESINSDEERGEYELEKLELADV